MISKSKLKLLPLGGLGQIGMNCMVLEWEETMVLIDFGVQFPDETVPGVDLLIPDIEYLRKNRSRIRGIVVTHGHDDHIGGIPFLAMELGVPLDVYATPFPQGLLHHKLLEFPYTSDVYFHKIVPRTKFTIGPFTFDPIPVQHSIIESLALAIETPVGVVIHTGDFKHDPNEVKGQVIGFEVFQEYGSRGVQLLLSDSTNAELSGHTLSEADIASSFEQIFKEQKSRLLIALFASNVRRIENLLRIAHQHGKHVAFAGRSMHSYTRLAHEQGSLEIPPDTLILLENVKQFPDHKVIVLLTGSQAEPRSALVRIAEGSHKDFQIRPGDRVIMSSRFIPGNEKNIAAMIDQLFRTGADVTYEAIHQIHVSGHGFQEELLLMLKATRPKYFVPIHGEYRHLAKHSHLAAQVVPAENTFVIENGQMVELDEETFELGEKLELKKSALVGGTLMDGSKELFSQRAALAKTGVVVVHVLRNKKSKRLVEKPRVKAYGILYRKTVNPDDALDALEDYLDGTIDEIPDEEDLYESLRVEARRYFKKCASHKPVVIPLIIEI